MPSRLVGGADPDRGRQEEDTKEEGRRGARLRRVGPADQLPFARATALGMAAARRRSRIADHHRRRRRRHTKRLCCGGVPLAAAPVVRG